MASGKIFFVFLGRTNTLVLKNRNKTNLKYNAGGY